MSPSASAPSRAASRPRVDDALLVGLASRLTERDRFVIRLVFEHRVLTTAQIAEVGFDSLRRAEARLAQLHGLRVLERFRPFATAGSAPFHWVLDEAGAHLLAAEAGVEVGELAWRRDRSLALATSQRLAHTVGANGVFTALIAAGRRGGDLRLAQWWSERRCAAEWGALVRPDGYGVIEGHGRRVAFLLEYDAGTERLARLAAKLTGYAALAEAAGAPTWVAFAFASSRREAEARRVLAHPAVPVATAALAGGPDSAGRGPAGAVWLAVGRPGATRRHLVDLGPPGATAGRLGRTSGQAGSAELGQRPSW